MILIHLYFFLFLHGQLRVMVYLTTSVFILNKKTLMGILKISHLRESTSHVNTRNTFELDIRREDREA